MSQLLAEAIRRAAPYAGRFAYLAVCRLAAFIAVVVVRSLRAHGVNVPAGAEQWAAAAASFAAAHGMNPAAAAARGIYDKTGIALSVSWDLNAEPPIRYVPYSVPAPSPAPVFEPQVGPQTILQDRLAAGMVSSDMVMPTFPPMYQ